MRLNGLRERRGNVGDLRTLNAFMTLSVDDIILWRGNSLGKTTSPAWELDPPRKMCVAIHYPIRSLLTYVLCHNRSLYPSSVLKFTVYRNGKVKGTKILAEFEGLLPMFLYADDGMLKFN